MSLRTARPSTASSSSRPTTTATRRPTSSLARREALLQQLFHAAPTTTTAAAANSSSSLLSSSYRQTSATSHKKATAAKHFAVRKDPAPHEEKDHDDASAASPTARLLSSSSKILSKGKWSEAMNRGAMTDERHYDKDDDGRKRLPSPSPSPFLPRDLHHHQQQTKEQQQQHGWASPDPHTPSQQLHHTTVTLELSNIAAVEDVGSPVGGRGLMRQHGEDARDAFCRTERLFPPPPPAVPSGPQHSLPHRSLHRSASTMEAIDALLHSPSPRKFNLLPQSMMSIVPSHGTSVVGHSDVGYGMASASSPLPLQGGAESVARDLSDSLSFAQQQHQQEMSLPGAHHHTSEEATMQSTAAASRSSHATRWQPEQDSSPPSFRVAPIPTAEWDDTSLNKTAGPWRGIETEWSPSQPNPIEAYFPPQLLRQDDTRKGSARSPTTIFVGPQWGMSSLPIPPHPSTPPPRKQGERRQIMTAGELVERSSHPPYPCDVGRANRNLFVPQQGGNDVRLTRSTVCPIQALSTNALAVPAGAFGKHQNQKAFELLPKPFDPLNEDRRRVSLRESESLSSWSSGAVGGAAFSSTRRVERRNIDTYL